MDDGLSLGTLWEETAAFVRAEAALLLPVAFALFGVPIVVLQLLAPQPFVVGGRLVEGQWMWALIPFALFMMAGSVAISALALKPGISVGEALGTALRALPAGVALGLFGLAGMFALAFLMSIAAGIEMALIGRSGPVLTLAMLIAFVAMIFVAVRAMPVWALIADGTRAPRVALRIAFAITRRAYLKLLLLRIVAWISQVVALCVVLVPLAVIVDIAGRLTGQPQVGETLTLVVGGAAMATVVMVWTVFVARLYRRLMAISGM